MIKKDKKFGIIEHPDYGMVLHLPNDNDLKDTIARVVEDKAANVIIIDNDPKPDIDLIKNALPYRMRDIPIVQPMVIDGGYSETNNRSARRKKEREERLRKKRNLKK